MRKNIGRLMLAVVALLMAAPLPAAVRLPRIFGDNMVLQQGQSVPIWGWAGKGEQVTVAFAGQVKTAVAGADGRWMIKLDPLSASKEPAEIKVSGANTLTLKNVVVGEVWLCSGQSNMDNTLIGPNVFNAEAEIATATNPAIRQFEVPPVSSFIRREDLPSGSWVICSPRTAADFSAVAYFFARELARELDIPVGLINSSIGGTPIELWIGAEGYRLMPELKSFVPVFEAWDATTEIGHRKYAEYLAQLKEWLPAAEAALAARRQVPERPAVPEASAPRIAPTVLFNGMIQPLIPFAVRGALWYQGEGSYNPKYLLLLKALIGGWRQLWGAGDFPFHIVQLPNFQFGAGDPADAAGGSGYAQTREAQLQAASAITNTSIVVTIDIGESNNIHPRNKQDVGARLARLALAKDYHKNIVAAGPSYQGFKIEPGRIRVLFDNVGGGLMVGEKKGLEPVRALPEGKLQWFAIAGADQVWQWADAVIDGDTVVVSSAKVPVPVAVRYAFTANPTGRFLYNKEGLPATPFRTDNWK